jgi:hypothetical protein
MEGYELSAEQYEAIENQTGYSKEALDSLFAAGIVPDEIKLIKQQMDQADQLRNADIPGGVQAGRAFHADHPGSVVGAMMKQYAGRKKMNKAEEKYASALKGLMKNRQASMSDTMMGPRTPPLPVGQGAPSGLPPGLGY